MDPPKSTGRDLFEPGWLQARLDSVPGVSPTDVQATLAELTVWSVVESLGRTAPRTGVLRVCGGGARNSHLMRRLAACLPQVDVATIDVEGVAPDHVEAWAFAWLAQAFIEGTPGNLPEVTGAAGPRRLGALYPA
jgi:anhydro-N-acetylmuramic acid kinase